MNNNVSIQRCSDYNFDKVYSAVCKAIEEAGDFPDLLGKSVLIKPNLLFPVSPEKAVTTHPVVVDAVLTYIADKNPRRIIVGDSPGVALMDTAGKKTGIKDITLKHNAEWVDFTNPTLLEYHDGVKQKLFYPAKIVCECDVIISLPKLKTHEMMYYTGAMKNLFGVIPGLNKSRFHFNYPEKDDFATMIVDLVGALKPSFAIMDAIVAMEGPGPGSGYPKQVGILMASSNVLALDITAADLIGYDPMQIPILRIGLERKIWLDSIEQIQCLGANPDDVKPETFLRVKVLKDTGFIDKFLPKALYGFIKNLYVPRPFFSKNKCIACGKCVKICPADALELQGSKKKHINIDYNKCIRCYCCHEVCPVEAIRISRL